MGGCEYWAREELVMLQNIDGGRGYLPEINGLIHIQQLRKRKLAGGSVYKM